MSKRLSIIKASKGKTEVSPGQIFILQLFITGNLPNSARAIKNTKEICEKYLHGRYQLEIIDIYQQPFLALKESIIAVPVLIKRSPLPEERMIGDLSETNIVLEALHLI